MTDKSKFLIVVGAQKAGTTWLFSMLKQQPRIAFSFQKEVNYFSRSLEPISSKKRFIKNHVQPKCRGTAAKKNSRYREYLNFVMDENIYFMDDWYISCFKKKPKNEDKISQGIDLVFIDASPSYMGMPREGITHMARLLPEIEPILIVRDPVKRMISGTVMKVAEKSRQKPVDDDWIINMINSRQISLGNYSQAIPLYKRYFKEVKIIPFKDIPERPLELMRDIEERYGLDQIKYESLTEKTNSRTGLLQLSERVQNHIRKVCSDQYDYLVTEFGPQFLRKI